MKITGAVMLLFLLATRTPVAVAAECDPPGELDIYERATENATVARCMYRNVSEQLTKEVFYRQRSFAGPPFRPNDLVLYLIRVFQYDDQGRRARIEEYSADHELLSYALTEYRADGSQILSNYTSGGIKTTETWRTESGDRTVVQFDTEGQRPIAVRGLLLSARDLSGDWGKPIDGISCAIATSTLRGPVDQIHVYASLRNLSDRRFIIPIHSEYLHLEMRDETGRVVSQRSDYLERRAANRTRDERDPVSFGRTEIRPNHAEFWGGEVGLKEIYGDLPPGTYALTAAREIPELTDPIACGTLQITVAASDT